jgi:hypothetical protein
MRRSVLLVLVGCALLSPPGASAKFGISKTRVTLTRYRPPDVVLLGDTVDAVPHEAEVAVRSPWKADLGALRPRPTRVTDVRVLVEGGIVRLDKLAVRER